IEPVALRGEEITGQVELAATDERRRRTRCRQRRRVVALQDQMAAAVTCRLDGCRLGLRMCPPQQEYLRPRMPCSGFEQRVSECLPTSLGVARRCAFFDGQHRVEEQN